MFNSFTLHSENRGNLFNMVTHSVSQMYFWPFLTNMMLLNVYGRYTEVVYGSYRLLTLYLGGAAMGGLFINMAPVEGVSMGAGGALASVMMHFIMAKPNMLVYLFFFEVQATTVAAAFLAYTFINP